MKHICLSAVMAAFLMTTACNEPTEGQEEPKAGQSHNEAAGDPKAPEAVLFEEVQALHDEAMPKMGKLRGYQKQAQAKIDSLSNLKTKVAYDLKLEYEALLAGLQKADKGMMDWMGEFEPEPKFATTDETIKYLSSEKAKAQAMRDDIFRVMDLAKEKFGE